MFLALCFEFLFAMARAALEFSQSRRVSRALPASETIGLSLMFARSLEFSLS